MGYVSSGFIVRSICDIDLAYRPYTKNFLAKDMRIGKVKQVLNKVTVGGLFFLMRF